MANRALVIDDDKVALELLKYQLEREGYETILAERGEEGLGFIRDSEFDIILTDLNLPDISGIEMVRRSKEIAPQTEIIMVTGYGSVEKAIEAGDGQPVHV